MTFTMRAAPEVEGALTELPDPSRVSSDLRTVGEKLMRISRSLHKHTHDLEVAVEGTYAGDSSDPRVALLSNSLGVCRVADLELGRLNQTLQSMLMLVQRQGQVEKADNG